MADEYMMRLRMLRIMEGLGQKEVAEYLGIWQTVYSRYESGNTALPIRHLVRLCQLYRVSADEVLGIETPMEKKRLGLSLVEVMEISKNAEKS